MNNLASSAITRPEPTSHTLDVSRPPDTLDGPLSLSPRRAPDSYLRCGKNISVFHLAGFLGALFLVYVYVVCFLGVFFFFRISVFIGVMFESYGLFIINIYSFSNYPIVIIWYNCFHASSLPLFFSSLYTFYYTVNTFHNFEHYHLYGR